MAAQKGDVASATAVSSELSPTTTHTIVFTGTGFSPETLQINVGDSVSWENQSNQSLTVVGMPQFQIYLPLIMNGQSGSRSGYQPARGVAAPADNQPFELLVPIGEKGSQLFTEVGQIEFMAAGTENQGLLIIEEPPAVDPPAAAAECVDTPSDVAEGDSNDGEEVGVFFATAEDRNLIRWQWDDCSTARFEVYRSVNGGAYTLVSTVSPIFDPSEAEKVLNGTEPRWPDLFAYFQGLFLEASDLTSEKNYQGSNDLLNFIYANGLAGQHWTNQYYPLALVAGWGYLDLDITAGDQYSYRVVSIGGDETFTIGSVGSVTAGQKTPLLVPPDIKGINLKPGSQWIADQSGNWGVAQQNRRYDSQVYLTWDIPDGETSPPNQTIGYDVCEIIPAGPVPIPYPTLATSPTPAMPPGPGHQNNVILPGGVPNETDGPAYHARLDLDDTNLRSYAVGGLDLLNQPLCVAGNEASLSTPELLGAQDYIPPEPLESLVLLQEGASVRVTVALGEDSADHVGTIIQRTHNLQCKLGDDCWQKVATLPAGTLTWLDNAPGCENDPLEPVTCWYRAMSIDDVDNRSVPVGPKSIMIKDYDPPQQMDIVPERCRLNPDKNTCFGIYTDAVSVRINCRLSDDGEEVFLKEVDAAELNHIDLAEVINEVFKTPITIANAACRFNMVDVYGNMTSVEDSPTVNFRVDSENTDQLAQPIITTVETQVDDSENYQLEVSWDMPSNPNLHSFILVRENEDGSTHVINNIDPTLRSVIDDGPQLGVGSYMTTVIHANHLFDPLSNTVSEPRHHRLYGGEERPLGELTWINNTPSWNGETGVANLQLESDDADFSYHFAVFRSPTIDGEYVQITPILESYTLIMYDDDSARSGCNFYQVVTFDQRTGEPNAYSEPRSPITCLSLATDIFTPGPEGPVTPAPIGECVPAAHPDPPIYPFIFGGGFEVFIEGLDGGIGPDNVSGAGWVMIETAEETFPILISWDGLTVNAEGEVCSGTVDVDFDSLPYNHLRLQDGDGIVYRLTELQLQPWFGSGETNHSLATIEYELPDSILALDGNGDASGMVELTDVMMTNSLRFNHLFDPTASAAHSCATPEVAFQLKTLPLDVIPNGTVNFDLNGMTIEASCTRYVNRYNSEDANSNMLESPYSGLPQLELHNDGYLRSTYLGTDTTITPTGLHGGFATTRPLDWTAAYPYQMRVTVDEGLELELANSQIISGSGREGTVELNYHQTVDETKIGSFPGSFNAISVGPRGDLYAEVSTTANVDWDAFSIPQPAGWELYVGPVNSQHRVALDAADAQTADVERALMWRTSPDRTVPVNFTGGSFEGHLEPGLNRRLTDQTLAWDNCGDGHIFTSVSMDTYLRHGGVTQRHIPLFAEDETLDIYDYQFFVERFELQFLDNGLLNSDIRGEVYLPFPTNSRIKLVDVWFTENINDESQNENTCIGGGRIPEGEQDHNLEYWDIDTRLTSAEFRQVPGDEEPTRLWVLGDIRNLPHLTVGKNEAVLPAELSFLPDGNFNDDPASGPKYDRADYHFQGFPYLLENFRLSDWHSQGNGEKPVWSAAATTESNPGAAVWNDQGFIGLRGGLIAPYYGPLLIETANESGDHITMAAWDAELTGLASQPQVKKEWVKVARVSIEFDYDSLVHAYDSNSDEGLFVGFRARRFVPDRYATLPGTVLPPDLTLERLQILQLDTATVIEPGETNVFLGLSSGVALYQALAQADGISQASNPQMTGWSNQLGMNPTARDVYIDQYNIIHNLEGTFNFKETTDILDDLSDQSLSNLLDEDHVGGRTQGLLAERGINFRRLRGVIEREGTGLDVQFAKFHISMEVDLRGKDQDPNNVPTNSLDPTQEEEPPMFYAERMTLDIERHGDFLVQGKNIQSSAFNDKLDSFDATLLINSQTPQFEGGITLHGLQAGAMDIDNGSAVLGIGAELNYLGVSFDGEIGSSFDGLDVGGDVLLGVVDPDSEVLQFNFENAMDQILEDLDGQGGNLDEGILKGMYARAYVNKINLVKIGCLVDLKADAELAMWFFLESDNDINTGGRISPAVYGKVVCAVDARGDLNLVYQFDDGEHHFTGEGYVAGGIGWCSPSSWDDWEDKWWNDKGCMQAGAYLNVSYTGSSWDVDYDTAREKLLK